jgi:hypothetical protein
MNSNSDPTAIKRTLQQLKKNIRSSVLSMSLPTCLAIKSFVGIFCYVRLELRTIRIRLVDIPI